MVNCGIASIKVLNRTLRFLFFLSNLNILPTLKVLMTAVEELRLISIKSVMSYSAHVATTIVKSNTFHPLSKYYVSKAINFRTASIV